jgi:hypothetical protein
MAKIYIMNILYNFYLKNHCGNSQVMTADQQLTLLVRQLLYGSTLYCSIILIDECSKTGYNRRT